MGQAVVSPRCRNDPSPAPVLRGTLPPERAVRSKLQTGDHRSPLQQNPAMQAPIGKGCGRLSLRESQTSSCDACDSHSRHRKRDLPKLEEFYVQPRPSFSLVAGTFFSGVVGGGGGGAAAGAASAAPLAGAACPRK